MGLRPLLGLARFFSNEGSPVTFYYLLPFYYDLRLTTYDLPPTYDQRRTTYDPLGNWESLFRYGRLFAWVPKKLCLKRVC